MDETKLFTVAEVEAIVLDEYRRWKACEDGSDALVGISMGGMGACANILTRIHGFNIHQPPEAETGKDGA